MAVSPKNRSRRKPSGSRVAALAVLLLVVAAIAAYVLFAPSGKPDIPPAKKIPSQAGPTLPVVPQPQEPPRAVQPPPVTPGPYPAPPVVPEPVRPVSPGSRTARLAIIIDDMGSSLSEARSLAGIRLPLTFAIIPGLRADKDVAAYAAAHKIETMIHIPMQSREWPARRLEGNGLLVSMDADELQERVSGFISAFPDAVGVNNHMGSEFTEHEEKMTAVLQVLKKNGLFFVDSVTSPQSRGGEVARRLGVRSLRRNVFLDNQQERGYIIGQLDQAVSLARRNGSAVAICHPHPETIAALTAALPGLAARGVSLVPVSQLMR